MIRHVTIVVALLLAACNAPPPTGVTPAGAPALPTQAPTLTSVAATPTPQFSVTYGSPQEPGGLNPLLPDTGSSISAWQLLFDGLVIPDPKTGAPSPSLAQSWDASADGLTWTFHLRPNVKWSDGQPFTADDAIFTFDAIGDPKNGSPRRSSLDNVAAYDAPDPATFRVTLKQPDCSFLVTTMLTPIVPKHALANVADFKTDEFNFSRPVGTGLYTFKEWQRGDHLTLIANPNYWGGRANIDRWILRPVTNSQTIVAKLKLGEVDYATLNPEQIQEASAEPSLQLLSVFSPLLITYVAYNPERTLFQDKRVRQALTHAVDRQSIVDSLLYGQGQVLNSPITPVSWAFSTNVPIFEHAPDTARRLLTEAGWAPGADGILEKDGTRFAFTLTTNSSNAQRVAIVTILQDAWRKVGIQVQAEILDTGAFLARYQQAHNFDAIVTGGAGLTIDPDETSFFATSSIAAGTNFVQYSNPDVDRLLAQARTVPGCAQVDRKPLYEQFQQIVADDQPFTFLYASKTAIAISRRVQNVTPSPWIGNSPYIAWGIKDWTVSQ